MMSLWASNVNIQECNVFQHVSHSLVGGLLVTLMVGFGFLPQKFEPVMGPTNAFCCSVNVDGVVILLGDGRDTATL